MTTYKEAGVDIELAGRFVEKLKSLNPEIGGFAGLYPLGEHYLAASTDGVGSKLKIACSLNSHHTVGIDLVAMCVNDLLTTGAKPLFFLDYYASGKFDPEQAERVLFGIQEGCKQAGCPLLGGETAEMPGCYEEGFYDLAGFAVGIVEKKRLIDGSSVRVGDVVVGCASSGIHSNGYSLIREILKRRAIPLSASIDNSSLTLGEQLMFPTKIYASLLSSLQESCRLKAIAHITGGGLGGNLSRVLPKGLGALLRKQSWPIPPIFHWIKREAEVSEAEMEKTFNLGIGMALIVSLEEAREICRERSDCWIIGTVIQEEGVFFL